MAAAGASRWQSFINHPAGPKTIFFWAPIGKWMLVAAGLKDINRNVALAATGFIWTRYSFVITPVNVSLAAVNFFVGCTGLYQLIRVYNFQQQHPKIAAASQAKA